MLEECATYRKVKYTAFHLVSPRQPILEAAIVQTRLERLARSFLFDSEGDFRFAGSNGAGNGLRLLHTRVVCSFRVRVATAIVTGRTSCGKASKPLSKARRALLNRIRGAASDTDSSSRVSTTGGGSAGSVAAGSWWSSIRSRIVVVSAIPTALIGVSSC